VHDDLVAVLVEPGGVAAENHWQRVRPQPDAPQRPQIVVIQRRGADLDGRPPVGNRRLGPLAHLETRQRLTGSIRAARTANTFIEP
jgi:hypothetical protein